MMRLSVAVAAVAVGIAGFLGVAGEPIGVLQQSGRMLLIKSTDFPLEVGRFHTLNVSPAVYEFLAALG